MVLKMLLLNFSNVDIQFAKKNLFKGPTLLSRPYQPPAK